jgi:hypothetical protein
MDLQTPTVVLPPRRSCMEQHERFFLKKQIISFKSSFIWDAMKIALHME